MDALTFKMLLRNAFTPGEATPVKVGAASELINLVANGHDVAPYDSFTLVQLALLVTTDHEDMTPVPRIKSTQINFVPIGATFKFVDKESWYELVSSVTERRPNGSTVIRYRIISTIDLGVLTKTMPTKTLVSVLVENGQ